MWIDEQVDKLTGKQIQRSEIKNRQVDIKTDILVGKCFKSDR